MVAPEYWFPVRRGAARATRVRYAAQVYNHATPVHGLCTKDALLSIITGCGRRRRARAGSSTRSHPTGRGFRYHRTNARRGVRESRLYDATPLTFLVSRGPGGGLGGAYADFERACVTCKRVCAHGATRCVLARRFDARARSVGEHENVWIIKPTSLNRGIGIEVLRTKESIQAFLQAKLKGSPYLVQQCVAVRRCVALLRRLALVCRRCGMVRLTAGARGHVTAGT